ncbi:MAG TPA: hypothetical protein DEF07_08810 [Nitrosomonas sp.]|nr:hypothetical protein [Nitrosomonas sp.]
MLPPNPFFIHKHNPSDYFNKFVQKWMKMPMEMLNYTKLFSPWILKIFQSKTPVDLIAQDSRNI